MKSKLNAFFPFLLVTAPFLFIYLLTANQLFSFDAVTNAIACETNEPIRWFHPNHPLYPAVGVLWYRIERLFGYTGYSLYSLARLNSFLMAAGWGLLFSVLAKKCNKSLAGMVVFVLGSSTAVWTYATDGRAIGFSVFFSVLVIRAILELEDKKTGPNKQILALAGFSSLYVLAHAISIFHVPAVAWWLMKKKKSVALYAASVAGMVAVFYGLVTMLVIPSPRGNFFSWALGYAGFEGASHALESRYWVGTLSSLIRGLWAGWRHALFLPVNGSAAAVAVSHGFGLVLLGAILRAVFCVGKKSGGHRDISVLLFIWGGLVTVFLAFWSPGQEGFRLHVLVPWVVGTALVFSQHKKFLYGGFVIGTMLFLLNLMGPISHQAHIKNNTGFQTLREVHARLAPGDVFLTEQSPGFANIGVLLPYFFPSIKGGTLSGRLYAFRETSLEPLKNHFVAELKDGHSIYATEEIFSPLVHPAIEARFGLPPGSLGALWDQFSVSEAFSLKNGQRLWRIDRAG